MCPTKFWIKSFFSFQDEANRKLSEITILWAKEKAKEILSMKKFSKIWWFKRSKPFLSIRKNFTKKFAFYFSRYNFASIYLQLFGEHSKDHKSPSFLPWFRRVLLNFIFHLIYEWFLKLQLIGKYRQLAKLIHSSISWFASLRFHINIVSNF